MFLQDATMSFFQTFVHNNHVVHCVMFEIAMSFNYKKNNLNYCFIFPFHPYGGLASGDALANHIDHFKHL